MRRRLPILKAGQVEQPQSEPENASAQPEQGVSSRAPSGGPAGGESNDAETPEWLQKLRSQTEDETSQIEDQAPLAAADEMTDLPDWLKELTASPTALSEPGVSKVAKTETVSEPPANESPVSSQPLQDQPAPEESTSRGQWLLALDANPEQISPAASQANQPAADDISSLPVGTPQWLSGISTGEPTPPEPATSQPQSKDANAAPDWLANFESDHSIAQPKEDQPVPFEAETSPEWLTRLQADGTSPKNPAAGDSIPSFYRGCFSANQQRATHQPIFIKRSARLAGPHDLARGDPGG